ncbi:MAG: hypothetical protein ROZ09_11635 [Thiobacillus sp.]|jgi:tetratricopeptide (TPR) repeat protein|uniref:hypothetical protein n=1 Tax=Thiobacillus sp. TaxID=924 RepID=UPI0028956BBF|nr:hypothetical protein [Thiobacillus sp.]MDT3707471.1 hypothetical protein [Thiobacillus sp.]
MGSITLVARDHTPDEARIAALLRQSTVHKNDKNYDAAIACLREAYGLMERASTVWGFKEYFRLPRCLHLAGCYEEAVAELQKLHDGLADFERRRKAAGFFPMDATVQRNIRSMIKREIAATEEREQKIHNRKKPKSPI